MAAHRTDPPRIDLDHCPLCGGVNGCAMAAGEPAAQCWCQDVVITPGLLQRLAPEDRGTRCICRQCVDKQGESTSER